MAAIVVARDKKNILITLPTNCGKTFVGGLLYQYIKQILGKTTIAVVPTEELRAQMIN